MAQKHNNDEKSKLKRKQYMKELQRLQAELCHLHSKNGSKRKAAGS